jgi:micrococcal nuclease
MGNLCSYNFKSKKEVFTWDVTKPYVPTIEKGTVIKIYDGDTITIGGYVKGDPMKYRFSVRLLGIDCPEIKSHDSFEKKHALEGKQYLEFIFLNKEVTLKNITTEKYGRLLADVYFENTHINQLMLDKKFAIPYDGKTKDKNFNWKEFTSS